MHQKATLVNIVEIQRDIDDISTISFCNIIYRHFDQVTCLWIRLSQFIQFQL
jgi:hypothetical protein